VHILLHVPERRELDDAEFLRRLRHLYKGPAVKAIGESISSLREGGAHAQAEKLKAKYTYRMYELSEFAKNLKQRVTQSYNRRHGRKGTLWEDRFKSPLIEGSGSTLARVAAYIDLNAVRADLVNDPKDYRFCGYGEAMGGGVEARRGIRDIVMTFGAAHRWAKSAGIYRQWVFGQGEQKGQTEQSGPLRAGFDREKVCRVLASGGMLSRSELLRCRVRYFSDGVALGSKAYVEDVFIRYRRHFSARRKTGARRMAGGDWEGLCSLRRLRVNVISLPTSA